MPRFDAAPADGGISLAAQEDAARQREDERRREGYLARLDREIHQHALDVLGILQTGGSRSDLLTAIRGAIHWGVREGVTRAESGEAAEWIAGRPV